MDPAKESRHAPGEEDLEEFGLGYEREAAPAAPAVAPAAAPAAKVQPFGAGVARALGNGIHWPTVQGGIDMAVAFKAAAADGAPSDVSVGELPAPAPGRSLSFEQLRELASYR